MSLNPVASAIRDILTSIRQRKRVNEVLELMLNRAAEICRATHGSIITVDFQNQRLIITCTSGKGWTPEKQSRQLRVGQGITGHVAKSGLPYLCKDTTHDPVYFSLFDHIKCEIVVPILVDRKVWGLVNLESTNADSFGDSELNNVALLAELAAFAIKLQLDHNEKERLQRHLMQAEKLASLGETIAGIAHEINNPLTSIISHASLLNLRRGGEADEISIKAILHHSKRTEEVVKNLLAFSRKENNQREAIGVNELLKQTINLKLYQLKVKNITLEYEPCEVSWPVLVNAPQIQQVLHNLLSNAEQAIEKNDGTPGVIRIEVGRRGDDVYISISDNGKGIPAEVMPFIFDPFFTTKGLNEGTGLGLSIVHTMIENHGGRVTVKSIPRQTVFTIDLPLTTVPITTAAFETFAPPAFETEPPPAPVIEPPPIPKPAPVYTPRSQVNSTFATPQASPSAMPNPIAAQASSTADKEKETVPKIGRVLVVDDEQAIVGAVCDFMEMMDIASDKAFDGLQAMELLKVNRYDAIISDIRMPNMDGKKLFAEAVKFQPEYNKRFIFMSGDLVRDTTQAFVKTITCPFLAKPFALHQMHKLVVPLLDRYSEGKV